MGAPKRLLGAELEDKALGAGKGGAGDRYGKENAVWAFVRIDAAGDVDVPHDLGVVPVRVELVDWENAATPGVYISARPVKPEMWTTRNARVSIAVISGTVAGTLARFKVGGA